MLAQTTHISSLLLLTATEDNWWGSNAGARWRGSRGPSHSVNIVTAHDGFSLADLVAFNDKHNHANGEKNR